MTSQTKKDQQKTIEALVVKAQSGNKQAFAEIYKLLSDSIYRYTLFKTNSHEDAKDLTSETFRRVWSYIYKYRAKNFKSYLFRIAHNLLVDYYKKNQQIKVTDLDYIQWLPDQKINIEKEYQKKEEIKLIYKTINKLKQSYKEVLLLRFVEELNIQETAEILKKSSGAVRVLQHRACKKLESLLKENG